MEVGCGERGDASVGDKEESSLEIINPTPIKGNDPFLRIRKKIGSVVSLEVPNQTKLAVTGNSEEVAPALKKRAQFQKGKGKGVKTPTTVVL